MNRCKRCRRVLKDPESKRREHGARCWQIRIAEQEKDVYQLPLFNETTNFKGNVVLKRYGADPVTNIPLRDSQFGYIYDWGHGGTAVSGLALNILLMFTDGQTAIRLHQQFKDDYLMDIPYSGGTILGNVIKKWIRDAS